MKPVFEDEVSQGDAGQKTKIFSNPEPTKRGSWLARIGMLLALVAVAILGFGSSAGWFPNASVDIEDNSVASAGTNREAVATSSNPSATQSLPSNSASTDGANFASGNGNTGSPSTNSDTQTTADTSASDLASSNLASSAATGAASKVNQSDSLPPLSPAPPESGKDVTDEAQKVVEHLVELLPTSIEAKEVQARYEYEFGDPQKARALWESIIKSNPGYLYAYRGLGDVATIDGRLDDACDFFRKAVELDPKDLTRQVTLGIALLHAAKLDEAKQVLTKVIDSNPERIDAHVELASVLSQLEEYEAARDHFEIALKSLPEKAEIHFGLANTYARLGEREKAKVHQLEHRRLQKLVVDEREKGRREYDDLKALQLDVSNTYIDAARVYMAGGFRKAAELLLLRSSRMNPSNIDCRQALAAISVGQGKLYDAIRWLKEIDALQPNQYSIIGEIARLYLQVGQIDEAEAALQKFLNANPKNALGHRSAAQFYTGIKPNEELAIKHVELAQELDPTAEGYAMCASVYELFDKTDKAIAALEKAIALDPENASYREVLEMARNKDDLLEIQAESTSPESGTGLSPIPGLKP